MKVIIALMKKELRSYFNSPIAYIFITVFLVLSSFFFFRGFFIDNQASMRGYFFLMPWFFLFLIPAITMRLWAEEKKVGTIEVLMTLPVRDYEVVLGKFLASLVFLAISMGFSFPIVFIVMLWGEPDFGLIVTQYFSTLLLGASYLSIGLFVSSFTKNQIVAFIVAVAISFGLFIIGEPIVLFTIPNFFVPLFQYLGLGTHFDSIARGVIDTRDLLYYFSIIGLFLLLNARNIASRQWK